MKRESGSNKKVANSLVALSATAVMAVYSAGYLRTRAAAGMLDAQAAERRPAPPSPAPGATAIPAALPEKYDAPAGTSRSVAPQEPERKPAETPQPVAIAKPVAAAPAKPEAAPPLTPLPAAEPVIPAPEPKVEVPVAAVVPVPPPPPPAPPTPPAPVWKDGKYEGWGTSRHGDIQAAVVIEGGHIASATIAQCLTRYSCSVIEKLPPQVAQRQSPEVDYVSGATQSANAFYYAVVDALNKAK